MSVTLITLNENIQNRNITTELFTDAIFTSYVCVSLGRSLGRPFRDISRAERRRMPPEVGAGAVLPRPLPDSQLMRSRHLFGARLSNVARK